MTMSIADLDLPFMPLAPSGPAPARTRHQLADDDSWIFRTEIGYLVVGYDDILAVLRDPRWHSGLARMSGDVRPDFDQWRAERQPSLLLMDGEDHQRLRRVIAPALTPKSADAVRPFMRQTIDELLDPLFEAGGGDFVAQVSDPYPRRVIFEVLGVDPGFEEAFRSVVQPYQLLDLDPAVDPDLVMAATTALDEFVAGLVDEADPRPDGLLSLLVDARSAGDLSTGELISLVESMLLAGTESTRAQLASAVTLFARFDDQFQLLRDQPDLAPAAVEECMRYLGAVRGTARVASEDIIHRNVRFPKGTLLMVAFSAANRDVLVAPQPNRFDITNQGGRPHLTLGHGTHFCVGAALARAELGEALIALAAKAEHLAVEGDITWRPQTADFWGPEVLPIRLG